MEVQMDGADPTTQSSQFTKEVTNQIHNFKENTPAQCRSLHTEYMNASNVRFEVETCCCGAKFQWILDLNVAGADVTPKNINQIPNFYSLFPLAKLSALQSWTFGDVNGLISLACELRDTFNSIQLELLHGHPNKRLSFNCDIVKDFKGFECLVESSRDNGLIHLIFPLYNEKSPGDPLHGVKVHAVVKSSCTDGGYADVQLDFPKQMSLSTSYKPSKWDLSVSLWDYLPPVQMAIQSAWLKRKEFIDALVATFSVLEYDPIDFSRVFVMAKSKAPKSKIVRMIAFKLPMEFPEKAPEMTIHEMQGTQTWVLDPVLYRYSPRWAPQRMGEELIQHARTVNNQAWV